MNTKHIITIIIILAAIAGGVYYFKNQSIQAPVTSAPKETTNPNVGSTDIEKSYTLLDVQAHATSASCWTIVNNKVYDVTSWISRHPGGASAITSMCGQDATSQFEGQHGGERRPEQELAGFQIGVLLLGL